MNITKYFALNSARCDLPQVLLSPAANDVTLQPACAKNIFCR
ncbi:hypothetical protein [Klebsiella aerogenes EA1509E]|nr:hypothetical protein [Klebsiella aerogenes EA1509E]